MEKDKAAQSKEANINRIAKAYFKRDLNTTGYLEHVATNVSAIERALSEAYEMGFAAAFIKFVK